MGQFTKWLTGGLGWAFLGPIGGIVGFALGAIYEEASKTKNNVETTRGSFAASMLVLIAAVMKADGKILKSELDYVKIYLSRSFSVEDANEALKMLREILKQDIPVREVSEQIGAHLEYESRLQLLHLLFGVSKSDGHVDVSEVKVIEEIAFYMGISKDDIISIKAMFFEDTNAAYKILEVEPSASIDEIKKAYRKMATKYHPDKVSYLGEEMQNSAKEKFQKVNEAYEKIKKERNFV